MKTITFNDLLQEFKVTMPEALYSLLLNQPEIKTAMPDLTNWHYTTEAQAQAHKIDASRLQTAIETHLSHQTTPVQLSAKDLAKLTHTLVLVEYVRMAIIKFADKSVSHELMVQRFLQVQTLFPSLQSQDNGGSLVLDDLMPINLTALALLDKEQRVQVLRSMSQIVENRDSFLVDDAIARIGFTGGQIDYNLANLEVFSIMIVKEFGRQNQSHSASTSTSSSPENTITNDMHTPMLAAKDWRDTLLNTLRSMVRTNLPTNIISFAFELPPERMHEYAQLQAEIAKIIPEEYDRPTIIIRSRGRNRSPDDQIDLGLLGGMGPLSDAHIINSLLGRGDQHNANVLLVSSPAARDEEKTKNPEGHKAHKAFRMQLLGDLRRANCQKYAMLSNTAHLHRQGFKFITGDITSILLGSGTGKFINSVKEIAKKIKLQPVVNQPRTVMILGTTEAAVGDLYFSLLSSENPIYQFGAYTPTANKLPKEQVALQEYINAAKSSPEKANEIALAFYSDMATWIQIDSPSRILLGCTEIPLLLKCVLRNGKTVEQALKDQFKENCPVFIDSEEEMIHILNEERALLESNSPIGKIQTALQELKRKVATEADKESKNDRLAVLEAISVALGMEDRLHAASMLDDAMGMFRKYENVTPLLNKVPFVSRFVGEQPASSRYGRFASSTLGYTRHQSGQELYKLVCEVKDYLQRFPDDEPAAVFSIK